MRKGRWRWSLRVVVPGSRFSWRLQEATARGTHWPEAVWRTRLRALRGARRSTPKWHSERRPLRCEIQRKRLALFSVLFALAPIFRTISRYGEATSQDAADEWMPQ